MPDYSTYGVIKQSNEKKKVNKKITYHKPEPLANFKPSNTILSQVFQWCDECNKTVVHNIISMATICTICKTSQKILNNIQEEEFFVLF